MWTIYKPIFLKIGIILIPQETIFLKTCEEKESDKPGNNESKNFELLVDMFRNERERDK